VKRFLGILGMAALSAAASAAGGTLTINIISSGTATQTNGTVTTTSTGGMTKVTCTTALSATLGSTGSSHQTGVARWTPPNPGGFTVVARWTTSHPLTDTPPTSVEVRIKLYGGFEAHAKLTGTNPIGSNTVGGITKLGAAMMANAGANSTNTVDNYIPKNKGVKLLFDVSANMGFTQVSPSLYQATFPLAVNSLDAETMLNAVVGPSTATTSAKSNMKLSVTVTKTHY